MLCAEYENRIEVSQDKYELWCGVLHDVSDEELMAATVAWLRDDHPHPPRSGQLLQLAKTLAGGRVSDEAIEAEAGEAWGKVCQFLRGWSSQHDGAMDDKYPRIAATVAMVGGWSALRSMTSESLHNNTRPHFLRLYRSACKDGQARAAAAPAVEAAQAMQLSEARSGDAAPRPSESRARSGSGPVALDAQSFLDTVAPPASRRRRP